MRSVILLLAVVVARMTSIASASDPLQPYLNGKAPEIIRVLSSDNPAPENIQVKQVVFKSRNDSEIFAVIATPKSPGPHPGILVLHGGGGSAEVEKAMAWAQRGYVAVAPDLPGIADPKKLTHSKGPWSHLKYGEGRWQATPDTSSSVLFDAVLSAMESLYLLRSQPTVDKGRIGVVGISWGGYMTTMVCALAGDQVRAGFAIFGCGFYDLTAQMNTTMAKMPPEERERWLEQLDPGRRAKNIKAAFFLAGAANDFFYWPKAVQATLDAVPGEKNHLYAPNANHKVPLPGGTVFPKKAAEPFHPTAFQPLPTPSGSKANWLAMEPTYFDYYLKGEGQPLPRVSLVSSQDSHLARIHVTSPRPLAKLEIFWAAPHPDVMKRSWIAVPALPVGSDNYEAKLPTEATDWFAVVSDERPVTVSSDLVSIAPMKR